MLPDRKRKGRQGAVERVGIHGVKLSTQRFYPVIVDDDGNLHVSVMEPMDDITGAVVTIDSFHHEIHEGETFIVTYKSPDDTPLADDATIILHLTIGTSFPHLVFSGTCGGDAQIEFFEDPTVQGDGIAMAERNMKRTSAEPGDVVVVRDPTVNADGALLLDAFLPGGTGGNAGGGMLGMRDNSEWDLDPDKTYIVRLTNRAGNAQPASLLIQWYEESDN